MPTKVCTKCKQELLKLQHYSNLRWLPASDNMYKSDKWTPDGASICKQLLGREWNNE